MRLARVRRACRLPALHRRGRGAAQRPQPPRAAPTRAFEALLAKEGEKHAWRATVGLLTLAHDRACEAELAEAIKAALDAGELPDLDRLRERFKPDRLAIPDVAVALTPLSAFDELVAVRAPSAAALCERGLA